jgi:hypothetical protein
VQNILAGLVATWNTFSVYVDPMDLFGAAGMSALLGFGMAHGLVGEEIPDAASDAIRSGTIGALFSVSTAFGYGALAGFTVCRLARAMAKQHNTLSQERLSVDPQAYRLLVETLCSGRSDIKEILAATAPTRLPANELELPNMPRTLPYAAKALPTNMRTLDAQAVTLPPLAHALSGRFITLPDEPQGLSEIYRSARLSLNSQRER